MLARGCGQGAAQLAARRDLGSGRAQRLKAIAPIAVAGNGQAAGAGGDTGGGSTGLGPSQATVRIEYRGRQVEVSAKMASAGPPLLLLRC